MVLTWSLCETTAVDEKGTLRPRSTYQEQRTLQWRHVLEGKGMEVLAYSVI